MTTPSKPRKPIGLVLAWYDLWIGAYWDRDTRTLYLLPIPCIGLRIYFGCVLDALIEARRVWERQRDRCD